MIPEIGSESTRDVGVCVVKVPPPLRFKEPKGLISEVKIRGACRPNVVGTEAQKGGVRYEIKAQRWLEKNLPGYQASRQFTFRDEGGFRSIIPDGYLLYDDMIDTRMTIFEIKSRHTSDAWWQLEKLYKPVLKEWLKSQGRRPVIRLVEVCRSFDPAVNFPTKVHLAKDFVYLLWALQNIDDDGFLVFELRP